ncbi:MAG: PAS domain S-box protein [Magnetococcales bacterium]|nr:PAS domain S-box protein [Magnetococcales bacterium]
MFSAMGAGKRELMVRSLDRPVFGLLPLIVFMVLLVVSVGTVVMFAQTQKANLKREFQEKMLGIGTLKARQIDDWVEQYYRDALLLQKNSMLSQTVALWLNQGRQPDDLSRMILGRLNSRKSLLQYREILLLSESGEVLLATSPGTGVDEACQRLVRESMADGQIRFSSIRLDPASSGTIRLDVIAPMELESAAGIKRVAALLLSIDVHQFLYPLLSEWPTPSRSAETLLVTRDGDEVVFLNELRHRKNTTLQFRLPIVAGSDIPAVRGVTGERGIMEGRDYRRESVLAATIPMRRMPWVMVAKIDQEEVYAPLRMQTWFSVVAILFVLAMAAIGLRLWWVNNTQALLRKSMDRLNLSQQLALVGSWDWDPYPDREVWSETLYSLLGLPMGAVEANRITFQQCVHPDDRAQTMWELYARIERENSFMRSYRIVRPDGQQRFVLEKGAVFRGKSGRIKRVIGVLLDVTERRGAEEQEQYYIRQLEKSNRAYRALSRCNAIGYCARDEEQLFRNICTIIQECCGYRLVWIGLAEHGPERWVRPVAHAGFEEGYLDHLRISWGDSELGQGPTGRAIRTGQPVLNQDSGANASFSPWLKVADERGYASSAAFPICYAGHCSGALNVYADQPYAFVDEEVQLFSEIAANVGHSLHLLRLRHRQQQDEAAVRRHRSQLQAIFDASIAAIMQLDLSGRILLANRSMMEMFGYPREDLPTLSYFDLVHPSLHEVARHSLTSQIQVDVERLYVRRDGSVFWGHLMGRRMPDLPDMDSSVIAIITDSTERKATEVALQNAKDEAVLANKAKNIFLASISHEIRTPLHAVINLGFLASLHTKDTVIHPYLLKIQEAGKALSRIIDDLLDLSKVEAGALVMELLPFRLMDVLNNLMTLVGTLNRKPLDLRIQVDPAMPPALHGDPQRLGQVLLNLMNNAIKFTDQGSVSLAVELAHPGEQEVGLRFTVTDTGCGMDASQLRQLFQPFYQGDQGLARRSGGAGLGLAICRHLVTLMGGEFRVDSQPGLGSAFSFTAFFGVASLPLEEGESIGGALSGLDEDLQSAREYLSGAHVLVVEDVEINQLIITELLQRVGVEVLVAGSGRQALELLENHICDLVLLDLKMPDLDGFEVARRLRAIPRLRDLPIIAMTAYAFSSDRQRCLESGMNDHLAKPIDRTLLYATLKRWVRSLARPASDPAFDPDAGPGPVSALPVVSKPVENPMEEDALLPAQLPGIELEMGLGRVLGNKLLYRVLLRKFGQTYARSGLEVSQRLQAGDDGPARQLLHALAGVSGNLGAQDLMLAARALEGVCVPGCGPDAPAVKEALNQFLSCLSQVMGSVQSLLETRGETGRSLDREALDQARNHVGVLEDLVRQSNVVDAMNETSLLQQQLLKTSWMEDVEQLMVHLFDGNLVLAGTVVGRLKENLSESEAGE